MGVDMQDRFVFEAAVLVKERAPLEILKVAIGELHPHDVLVRIRASGLCHSDLEVMDGSLKRPLPIVPGHEAAGVVVRTGASVESVAPGDHVTCSWNPNCGHCFYCVRNAPILCEPQVRNHPRGRLIDGTTRLQIEDGAPVNHFSGVSGLAEYCVVQESAAIKIPVELPFDQACLIGCAVMTGIGSVVRLANVEPGSAIGIVGAGPIGLNAIQGGIIAGAEKIIAIDRGPQRLRRAMEFGATHALDASSAGLTEQVQALTGGRGVDYVFEAAGATVAMHLALDILRPGGSMVILGKVDENEEIRFRFGSMMKEKRITRSSYGGARPARDFPWIARLALDGKIQLANLITSRLPLSRVNEGFDQMRQGKGLRTIVEFPA